MKDEELFKAMRDKLFELRCRLATEVLSTKEIIKLEEEITKLVDDIKEYLFNKNLLEREKEYDKYKRRWKFKYNKP